MRISLAALCLFVSLVCGAADTGDLPPHTAAARGDVPALGRAIRSGTDIERGNAAGKTPLMVAIQSEQVEAIAALLEAGASPDHADRLGGSPLHLAAAGPAEVAELLTQAGADVNARNARGVTALMLAAAAGQSDVVELLLSSGARLDFRDYQGNSAADWAEGGGQGGLAQMLRGKTADPETGSSNTASQYDFDEDIFVDVEFPDWFKQSFLDLRDDLDEAISTGKQGLLLFFSTRRCSYWKALWGAHCNWCWRRATCRTPSSSAGDAHRPRRACSDGRVAETGHRRLPHLRPAQTSSSAERPLTSCEGPKGSPAFVRLGGASQSPSVSLQPPVLFGSSEH